MTTQTTAPKILTDADACNEAMKRWTESLALHGKKAAKSFKVLALWIGDLIVTGTKEEKDAEGNVVETPAIGYLEKSLQRAALIKRIGTWARDIRVKQKAACLAMPQSLGGVLNPDFIVDEATGRTAHDEAMDRLFARQKSEVHAGLRAWKSAVIYLPETSKRPARNVTIDATRGMQDPQSNQILPGLDLTDDMNRRMSKVYTDYVPTTVDRLNVDEKDIAADWDF